MKHPLKRTLLIAALSAPLLLTPIVAQQQAASNEALSALVQVLMQTSDPQLQLDILRGMSEGYRGQRSAQMPPNWGSVESKLASSQNQEVRALTQTLSLTFGSQQALAGLRKTLGDATADVNLRRGALEALLNARDPQLAPTLQALLQEPALRGPALKALASYEHPETAAAILKVYPQLGGTEKRDALSTLSSRATFAAPLLQAVASKQVPSRDLSADLIRQLRNLRNADLDKQIEQVWGVARETAADKKGEIEKYRKIYQAGGSQPGDAIRGRAVFVRTCQQCHSLFDVGGKVGPDLTGSNRGDLEYILQNMVDPNAVIPNDYRTSTIEMKDDRILTGIISEQNDQSLTVLTANETITLPKAEVQSVQQSDLSMMPEGLLGTLQDQEVRDLIYYLSRPGQVPLLATSDTVGAFFNGKDLSGWDGDESLWRVENGEIVGSTKTGLKDNEFLKSDMVAADFRLICKVKLSPNKENSGIQFRSQPELNGSVKGYQADVGAGWWGKLYEEHGRGLLWDKGGDQHVKVDDWNTYEIVAVGNRILTAINGKPCVDLTDAKGATQGIIAFQLHSGGPMEVRYKNLQLEANPKLNLRTVEEK
ncbi:MAG TPA: family 16 glycoside hydrolase [Methylomirabilota bacterium]|nr:family 16 glycoside hydrolase [Methylomirabilota bacterium]